MENYSIHYTCVEDQNPAPVVAAQNVSSLTLYAEVVSCYDMARCISPILVRNANRRDYVPCGKCNNCLQTKRASWSFRLLQELKTAHTARFLSFTYDDKTIPYNPESGEQSLCKRDVQLFFKRLRKEQAKISKHSIRYYTVGEYGTKTSRPHYHSIMFNLDNSLVNDLPEIWQNGICYVGEVNIASIHYTTKYVINRTGNDYEGREAPFALMSRRPGIGFNYVDTHRQWHRDDLRTYTQVNGIKQALPRYYREKMFEPWEREHLARLQQTMSKEQYWSTIERLKAFHADPMAYYDESMRYAHDQLTYRLNEKDKF